MPEGSTGSTGFCVTSGVGTVPVEPGSPADTGITVTGTGKVTGTPDTLRIALSVTATSQDVDTALASGELSIEYNGRRVTYRSVDELMNARRHFERLINGVTPGEAAPSTASQRCSTFRRRSPTTP